MDKKNYKDRALINQKKAYRVLNDSGIVEIWENAGCKVNLIGSLKMELLAAHRDIDLHVYSSGITEEQSFAIAAKMAAIPGVTEIKYINGLQTDEHCISWHVKYIDEDEEDWTFDIIHIETGSRYDGYFERMAERIVDVMTPEQKETILRLKFETPVAEKIRGVEYYEAVIADGVTTLEDLRRWIQAHRARPQYYWIP
ncbi:MAG: phosphoglycerate mutase family protein [Muribaculaceae bacterium]|nr:phosphoglycerate mutase family protein [Muribaculaceae bacterium]